jgi:hypothetical protein
LSWRAFMALRVHKYLETMVVKNNVEMVKKII